ncbi:MAG: cyclic nucleotide-binding domain-containing protein [Anaerolineaceae bacterium]|nr:cyclic nucleotide-binding domain-containing protein [Anaerolineaceae bacterium]
MAVERPQIAELIKSIYIFKKTNEVQSNLVLDSLELSDVSDGEVVFKEGQPPEKLYIILNGRIRITRIHKERRQLVGVLNRGDIFGFEMLEYNRSCLTTTTALEDTTLLCLDRKSTRLLLQNIPTLNLDLKILFESYLLGLKTQLNWRDPEEVIYFISRRHLVYLLLRFLPIILLAAVTFSVLLNLVFVKYPGLMTPVIILVADSLGLTLWGIWSYVDWANDYSILTNQRLLYQEKIVMLYDSRQEAPLHAILSVSTTTDWLGRTFSFGDVVVRTYAGSIILPKLSNPRQVSTLIEVQLARIKTGRAREEREKLDDVIRGRIGLKPEEPPQQDKPKPVQPQLKTNAVLNWLANMFQLRLERGGVIVFRTHWFILLKRIWLPTLLLLIFAATFVLRFFEFYTFLSLMAILGLVLVAEIIVGIWWVYQYVDWRNDHYVITPEQIVDVNKKPLGKEVRRAAPLKNVLSIEFERLGLIGLILNFGTVYISVGETTLTFDYVFNPAEVQRELFNHLASLDDKEKLDAKNSAEKHVADWIAAYHRVVEDDHEGGRHIQSHKN